MIYSYGFIRTTKNNKLFLYDVCLIVLNDFEGTRYILKNILLGIDSISNLNYTVVTT